MTAAGVLEVVDLDLPSIDGEVICEARNVPGDGARCGAVPVTHWAVMACPGPCSPQRKAVCAGHAAEVRRRFPQGAARDNRCGLLGTATLIPVGGA